MMASVLLLLLLPRLLCWPVKLLVPVSVSKTLLHMAVCAEHTPPTVSLLLLFLLLLLQVLPLLLTRLYALCTHQQLLCMLTFVASFSFCSSARLPPVASLPPANSTSKRVSA
jgi:hypothetical protein